MAKGLDAGNAFLAGVLAKLSPEDRQRGEEALATLKTLGGGTVIAAVGDGTLGQEEVSRQLDAARTQAQELADRQKEIEAEDLRLTTWRQNLTDWYAEEKRKAEAGGGGGGIERNADGTIKKPVEKIPAGLTLDTLNETLANERAAFLGFARDQNEITRLHAQKFGGEIVDLEPLLRHPQIAQFGLKGIYELVHKDRLTKWDTDTKQKAEELIRLDERQKVLAQQAQMPYPTPNGPGSGSPLDALTAKTPPLVDAAVEHYNRLQLERTGARPS